MCLRRTPGPKDTLGGCHSGCASGDPRWTWSFHHWIRRKKIRHYRHCKAKFADQVANAEGVTVQDAWMPAMIVT